MTTLDLNRLPSPNDPDFGEQIRRLDMAMSDSENEFRALLENYSATLDQRFVGFYGLLHRMRREYRFKEYGELIRTYESEFGNQPFFDTFRVVLARWTGDDIRGLKQAVKPAEHAVTSMPNNPWVLHQYAELIATLGEMDETSAPKYLPKAIERIDRAIDIDPPYSAVYYATRARLYILSGGLDSARADIEHAIANEDPSSRDYPRRISRYEGVRLLVIIRQQQQRLESRQQAFLAELDQFKGQQLSLLGLLTALIALIVVTASTVTKVNPTEAIRLIAASGGVIVIVFSGVAGVLIGTRLRRVSLAIVIGLAMILASTLIHL